MKSSPEYRFSDDELNWLAEHLDDAASWTREDRILRNTLVFTLLLGLVMHVLGFAIASGAFGLRDQWPATLAADLLATLGIALWTAVVLVLFLEVWPSRTRRRAWRYYRGAVAALRERGDPIPAEAVEPEDPIQAKLDAILVRIGTIEAAVTSSTNPDTRSG